MLELGSVPLGSKNIISAVILEKYGEQFFSKGFSTDYGLK